MIPGGNLRDVEAIAKHFYYESERHRENSNIPLIFMGVCSVAIGATMIWHGGMKLWADRVKAQATAQGHPRQDPG